MTGKSLLRQEYSENAFQGKVVVLLALWQRGGADRSKSVSEWISGLYFYPWRFRRIDQWQYDSMGLCLWQFWSPLPCEFGEGSWNGISISADDSAILMYQEDSKLIISINGTEVNTFLNKTIFKRNWMNSSGNVHQKFSNKFSTTSTLNKQFKKHHVYNRKSPREKTENHQMQWAERSFSTKQHKQPFTWPTNETTMMLEGAFGICQEANCVYRLATIDVTKSSAGFWSCSQI